MVVPEGVPLGNKYIDVRLDPVRSREGTTEFARVLADGTFTLFHVAAGRYRVGVVSGSTIALPWSVRGISLSGRALPEEILDVSAGANVTGVLVQLATR